MSTSEYTQQGLLTPQQITFYKTFGFLVRRQVFSPEEMQIIEREFESLMLEARDGNPFDGKETQVVGCIERRPVFKSMIEDDTRIHGSVEQLLGPDFTLEEELRPETPNSGTYANLCVGDTTWHGDHGWHPSWYQGGDPDPKFVETRYHPSLKVAFYLDRVTRDTGCLRVIPGTHFVFWPAKHPGDAHHTVGPFTESLASIHMDIPKNFLPDGTLKQFDVMPRDVPCHAIESEPGDVIIFNHHLWHASFGGRAGRRRIALNFRASPKVEAKRRYVQYK